MSGRPSSEAGAAGWPVADRASGGGGSAAEWRRVRYPQSLYRYGALLCSLVFVVWSLDVLKIDVQRLPGLLGRMLEVLARRYFPPKMVRVTQPDYLLAVLETLQMSYLATIVGILAAAPLAWLAAFNVTPSRRIGYPAARLAIMACRSVHEMIWTILFVSVLGFGMLPGTLALALSCIGFAGKLFAEAAEAVDRGQVDAIRATGAGRVQVFFYGVLPQVRVAWIGVALYAWDVVFRAATVVGFFGAGGMGWYLRESVQRVEFQEVSAILVSIVAVVIVAEMVSAWARARIAQAVA
jgi:phosphonate transport system permease protein